MKLKLKKQTFPGRLIVFEGTDGAGKTTLLKKSAVYLTEMLGKENVVVTKQPTDRARRSKLFRTMMYTPDPVVDYRAVQLLTLSDRLEHQKEVIVPALAQGKVVICDRYIFTSIVNMLARGYTKEKWFFDAASNILRPDAVFLATVEADTAIARIGSREKEKHRYLNKPLLYTVRQNFLDLSKKQGFCIVNTAGEPEDAFALVQEKINEVIRP